MGVKVFDLQLLVGRENIMGDKPRICIESIETCGKNLYIGTNDCFIHHFQLQESELLGRETFSVKQQGKKYIGMKKPILQIKAASALNHLLVNCDSTLVLLSMIDFSIATAVSGKIKNISKFYINQRPLNRNPFSVEICVSFSKRKSLQVYQVHEDRIVPMYEITLSDHPRNFCVDGKYACVGTTTAYLMVNVENNTKQELFPLQDDGKNLRMVNRVGPSEFVITATNGLGVFVSYDGTSNRPPLQWSEGVFASTLSHPYIIAIDDEFITVHSLLDQQQKQSLSFQGGCQITNCDDGIIIVCTPKDIFILTPVPLQSQLDSIIADKKIDEAITLIRMSKRRLNPEKFSALLKRVYCMSGFVRFLDFESDDAIEMFTLGSMDPRELISLFPKLLPEATDFKRALPPMHEIADINQMCSHDNAQILNCQEFLALYLEMICNEIFMKRNSSSLNQEPISSILNGLDAVAVNDLQSDIFYSTVILLAQLDKTEELQRYIQVDSTNNAICNLISPNYKYMPELISSLERCGCYHVCALIHLRLGDIENSMKVWHAIVLQQFKDSSFPGLPFVAEMLATHCNDLQVLWKNAEWILREDQYAGVKIFTLGKMNSVQPDDVVNFLHQYPHAVMDYLYHLVIVQQVQKEKYHTHLAVLYLERVLSLKSSEPQGSSESDVTKEARKMLQSILLQSDLYRIPLILGKTEEANLFQEQVILHSKLGEHNKALSILVHRVADPKAAKQYCLDHSKHDAVLRRQLFYNLLTVYLQDISVTKTSGSSNVAVIDLLNKHSEDFDAENIMQLLPNHWAVSVLEKFLHNSLREPLHELRNKTVEYAVSKSQVLQLQQQRISLNSSPIQMKEGKLCQVCNRQFNDSVFLRYPNGTVVHTHCSNDKHVCPISGKIFKTKKPGPQVS